MVTKSERVVLVATKKQLAAWRLAADSQGLSLSALLRRAADTDVQRIAQQVAVSRGEALGSVST